MAAKSKAKSKKPAKTPAMPGSVFVRVPETGWQDDDDQSAYLSAQCLADIYPDPMFAAEYKLVRIVRLAQELTVTEVKE